MTDFEPAHVDAPAVHPRADLLLSLLIFAGVAVYFSLLPWGLQAADESYFLVEAKRIHDGEIMYRDIFEFVTPLSPYAMAAMFWLFGTSMATARITMACVHGLTAVALYASARGVGVRKSLSLTVPLAYVGLCQLVWPYASWHWFSTLAAAVALCALVRGPWAQRPRWSFVPGVISGVAIGIQQQKGIVLAAATGLVFIVDALLDRRYGAPVAWRALATRLAWFTAGVAVVTVPLLATFLAIAGATPLYDALIRFPLETYGTHFSSAWGRAMAHEMQFTIPPLLRLSPLLVIPSFLRWFSDARFGRERERVRRLTPLVAVPSACVISTWYYPDLIHIAFIAGVFWVAAAEAAEWLIDARRRRVGRRRRGARAAPDTQHAASARRVRHRISDRLWARRLRRRVGSGPVGQSPRGLRRRSIARALFVPTLSLRVPHRRREEPDAVSVFLCAHVAGGSDGERSRDAQVAPFAVHRCVSVLVSTQRPGGAIHRRELRALADARRSGWVLSTLRPQGPTGVRRAGQGEALTRRWSRSSG
jgi:hypothetical protein